MERAGRIVTTILGTLLGLWFLLAGSQKFLARELFEQMFVDFGLPVWAVPVIGVIEIAGAVLAFIPRTAMWGATVIGVVMIGAVACHLLTGVGSPVASSVAVLMAATVAGLRLRAGRASRVTPGAD